MYAAILFTLIIRVNFGYGSCDPRLLHTYELTHTHTYKDNSIHTPAYTIIVSSPDSAPKREESGIHQALSGACFCSLMCQLDVTTIT